MGGLPTATWRALGAGPAAARRACGEYGLELLDTAFTLTLSGDVENAIDDAGEDSIAGDLADDDELDMADDADEDDADAGDVVGAFSRGGGKYFVMALSAPLASQALLGVPKTPKVINACSRWSR